MRDPGVRELTRYLEQRILSALLQEGTEAALEVYEQASSRSANPYRLQQTPLLLLCFLLLQSERQADAIEILYLVADELPEDYPALYILGVLFRLSGDSEAASSCMQAVLERCPAHRQAREALGEE